MLKIWRASYLDCVIKVSLMMMTKNTYAIFCLFEARTMRVLYNNDIE
jgi:hypothetical protein